MCVCVCVFEGLLFHGVKTIEDVCYAIQWHRLQFLNKTDPFITLIYSEGSDYIDYGGGTK